MRSMEDLLNNNYRQKPEIDNMKVWLLHDFRKPQQPAPNQRFAKQTVFFSS